MKNMFGSLYTSNAYQRCLRTKMVIIIGKLVSLDSVAPIPIPPPPTLFTTAGETISQVAIEIDLCK